MKLPKNKKIHIIKTGETYDFISAKFGDFEDMIIKKLSTPVEKILVWPVYKDSLLPAVDDIAAVIITGSHSMVTDFEPWSVYLADWLRKLSVRSIPILGICYGHQLIAQAFGGTVDFHPLGREFGTAKINITEEGKKDPLFCILPDYFYGHVAHSQTVIKLPTGARLLAANDFEKNHAFVINENIYGFQFHPEFSSSITNAYIDALGNTLKEEGYNVRYLKATVVENDIGTRLLRRFIELI